MFNARNLSLDTYAFLDDALSRTIILPAASQHINFKGKSEVLLLQTIRHQIVPVQWSNVFFLILPAGQHRKRYPIKNAITSSCLSLAEHSCLAEAWGGSILTWDSWLSSPSLRRPTSSLLAQFSSTWVILLSLSVWGTCGSSDSFRVGTIDMQTWPPSF